jgi:Reverse transcriptase (RNA-dependent DNA polymerase)
MAKVLSALIAADLTFISEKHHLLPDSQFGGRPGRSTTDALHLLVQKVKTAWRSHDVVTALFLDIKAAFPNVVKEVLLNNMRQRGIPEEYIEFTNVMLTGRFTRLAFDDHTSEDFAITNGNGQGCPLSMIFYAFYIAPLLEVAKNDRQESAIGFVDDSTLLARGATFEETHRILKDMMERVNGCFDWSRSHNSQFELSKLAIMDFTHSQEKKADSLDLELSRKDENGNIATTIVKRTEVYKLLGVRLDPRLLFRQHHDLVISRVVQWTARPKAYPSASPANFT